MKLKTLLLSTVLLLSSACSTIYFHNSGSNRTYLRSSQWHHEFIFGLIEGSSPIDLSQQCVGADWETIRTQQSFVQGFLGALTYSLYTPQEFSVGCYKKREVSTKKQ